MLKTDTPLVQALRVFGAIALAPDADPALRAAAQQCGGSTVVHQALTAPLAVAQALGGGLLRHQRSAAVLGSAGLCAAGEVLGAAGPFSAYQSPALLIESVARREPGLCPDSRPFLNALGRLPIVEVGAPDELVPLTYLALRLAERAGLPLALRVPARALAPTTLPGRRVAPVEPPGPPTGPPSFIGEDGPFVTSSLLSRYHEDHRERRLAALAPIAAALCSRTAGTAPGRRRGVVLAGHLGPGAQARAAQAGLATLRLGMAWPLPEKELLAFLGSVDEVVVLEEGEPFLLEKLHALCARAGVAVRLKAPEGLRARGGISDADLERVLGPARASEVPPGYDLAAAQAAAAALAPGLAALEAAGEEPWALHVARVSREHRPRGDEARAAFFGHLRRLARPSIVSAGMGPAGSLGLARRFVDVRLIPGGAAVLAGALCRATAVSGAEGAPETIAVLDHGDQADGELGDSRGGELLGALDNAQARRPVLHVYLGRSADSALEAQLRASGMEVIASELAAAPHALHYLSQRPGSRALFCTLA